MTLADRRRYMQIATQEGWHYALFPFDETGYVSHLSVTGVLEGQTVTVKYFNRSTGTDFLLDARGLGGKSIGWNTSVPRGDGEVSFTATKDGYFGVSGSQDLRAQKTSGNYTYMTKADCVLVKIK